MSCWPTRGRGNTLRGRANTHARPGGEPTHGHKPGEYLDGQQALDEAGHPMLSAGHRRLERLEEGDQEQERQRATQQQPAAEPAPARDAAKVQPDRQEAHHRGSDGQEEAEQVQHHRFEVEDPVDHHAQRRKHEQRRTGPAEGGPITGVGGLRDADHARQQQKAAQDEGRVHVRGGGTHAQPADGLADRRVGRDTGTPDRVPRAQEAQNEPGEREQDRASHGTPGEPAGARRNR